MKDPIIEEIHKFREEYAKRFNYDIDAIFDDIQSKQAKRPNVVDLSDRVSGKRAANVAEERAKYDGKK